MKKIAVLGFGCIGNGVCRLLTEEGGRLGGRLKYICDLRDISGRPYGEMHIKDFDVILSDPEVAVVAELTGARRSAFELSKKALEAGKSVVTSNKEVVSAYGPELLRIARENNVSYLFEAAVGGAIPLIRPLRMNLGTDRIESIYGILNGTTNYILTSMERGVPYEEALSQAKELGYAEPDPTADVTGLDSCRKISVLSAFIDGGIIPPEKIPTAGIENIPVAVLDAAASFGGRIKLIARAQRTENGVFACVSPCFVGKDNMLYNIDGVNNGITVRCRASGDLLFCGRGAGSVPTAAAVLSDIAEALHGTTAPLDFHIADECSVSLAGRRFIVSDKPLDGISYVEYHKGEGYHAYITDEDTEKYGSDVPAFEVL
ncbi:MAG: homoserine dehydrogenase [Clostridia bacterium]|nr:homoserine dehydrogenase [Clostridia bacterium]